MSTTTYTITDKKVFVNGVELLRLQKFYSKRYKRDIVSYKRKAYDVVTKKVVWAKWGQIDSWEHNNNRVHPIQNRNWVDEFAGKWKTWYVKSQEEINEEIIDIAKSVLKIVSHKTRGDLGGLYPDLEGLELEQEV
jgi:hypothetical protein